MPVSLAYANSDSVLAERLAKDLAEVSLRGDYPILVALISSSSVTDPDVLSQIDAAVAADSVVVPLSADKTPLPAALHGLKPLDFSAGAYPFDALRRQLDSLSVRPLTLRQRNRRNGLAVGGVAIFIFLVGLYAVGVLGIHAPQEEFEEVETARMDQRNTLIAPTLQPLIPVGQFAISQFELTVTAVPTRLREYLVQTVTATSQGTFIPSLTPRPTREP